MAGINTEAEVFDSTAAGYLRDLRLFAAIRVWDYKLPVCTGLDV